MDADVLPGTSGIGGSASWKASQSLGHLLLIANTRHVLIHVNMKST